ncbi:hypothetical protein E1295_47920 [Nonomuraea mesophila]|uniref:Uncharacterized protein n=1 Tax=Nonomuraea mesophila TaxID=2530382 RepID=A0A4R5E252_9ACTN|nr:hypothetical protein E1295_47920 [Nonomuraea mesophila]
MRRFCATDRASATAATHHTCAASTAAPNSAAAARLASPASATAAMPAVLPRCPVSASRTSACT